MSLQSLIQVSNKTAVIVPESKLELSYSQLNNIVYHLQSIFTNSVSPLTDKGSQKQLRIATCLPNGLELIASFLAITTAGNVITPLNPKYTRSEFLGYLSDLETDAVIVPRYGHLKPDSEIVSAARATPTKPFIIEIWYDTARSLLQYEIFHAQTLASMYNSVIDKSGLPPEEAGNHMPGLARNSDIALILFTSGTTGKAKKVPLTHSNLTSSMMNIIKSYKLRSRDRNYVIMPLFHIHGLQVLLASLASQGSVVVPNRFSASMFYPHLREWNFSWYSAVPTIHIILLNRRLPKELKGKLRFIRSCSSSLPPTVFTELESNFGCPVVEAYGMTEASHQVTSNNIPFHGKISRKAGTVGIPQGSVEVIIIDESEAILNKCQVGQVAISGPNVTLGYLQNETANKESFFNFQGKRFFKTGDLGMFDNEGRLVLKGRIKEIINKGGEKISPVEIDSVVSSHEKVKECVSFGYPDKKYGENIGCGIVCKNGASLTETELRTWLQDRLASFKLPQKIFIVQELPKSPTGKMNRRLMSQIFGLEAKV
ncbi:hypothetical protein KL918_000316 [Ogataea parapolymorpha]|uniref:Peroxisomal-coenzyme A synthetase n=1 Tax=Ogataea parapolymorpha (strain ATCC 26012 / BCRC 20466 / JCM 22074 / NRRL Y-7560 / DL-1) TaxID=871575 RepID=W1Q7K8_OGAPD|nr:Peroxisomal-coenzyme A synthetase [Ogataea parapolymorpha DL-1]ESW96363.1 Peroxisomal-coenzyme A synthetase [Ogataea parapolymorpha DL-1]KAG7870112.1 hypothetical protein KL918_000316 [Ogataea parapolymorpha]KAG7875061.1 hypothetical protein KL916_000673 [Ogataea parapolymorpha]